MLDIAATIFGFFCHQDPDRTIWLSGVDLEFCARCYGLHVGFAITWWLAFLIRRYRTAGEKRLYGDFFVTPAILALHWSAESFLGYQADAGERFFVGFVAGPSIAMIARHYLPPKGLNHNARTSIRNLGIAASILVSLAVSVAILPKEDAYALIGVLSLSTSVSVSIYVAVRAIHELFRQPVPEPQTEEES